MPWTSRKDWKVCGRAPGKTARIFLKFPPLPIWERRNWFRRSLKIWKKLSGRKLICANKLMIKDLFDMRMNDGSRHFADMPEAVFFDEIADHTENLEGAEITDFITDGVVEMWLDFEYRGHKFSVNNQLGDYWFFVEDADCPDDILLEVCDHFRQLLEK